MKTVFFYFTILLPISRLQFFQKLRLHKFCNMNDIAQREEGGKIVAKISAPIINETVAS